MAGTIIPELLHHLLPDFGAGRLPRGHAGHPLSAGHKLAVDVCYVTRALYGLGRNERLMRQMKRLVDLLVECVRVIAVLVGKFVALHEVVDIENFLRFPEFPQLLDVGIIRTLSLLHESLLVLHTHTLKTKKKCYNSSETCVCV